MSEFIITGGSRLEGDITVSGGKNAVLPIMAASVMARTPCVLHNAPDLVDVRVMSEILRGLGAVVERVNSGRSLYIDPSDLSNTVVDEALMRQVRSSIFLIGPLVARMGKATVSYPGGCDIGQRPIDQHLKGLAALGVAFEEAHGNIRPRHPNCRVPTFTRIYRQLVPLRT